MKSKFVLLTTFLVVSCYGQQNCSMTNPCTPLKGEEDFSVVEQIASVDGYLNSSLTVAASYFNLDWLTVKRRLYNERYTGPTFRVKPGDLFDLKLVNGLEDPDFEEAPINFFRFPNKTNLHTHGLHIASTEPQDNPFVEVNPGKNYQYMYKIHKDQPAGTYWYHPHTHGSVHFQVLSGMSGMLIVEDDPNHEISSYSCPNNCNREVQITFQSFQYADTDDAAFPVVQRDIQDDISFRLNNQLLEDNTTTLEEWLEDPVNDIRYVLVNGQLQPHKQIESGEIYRFRFVNAIGVHALALMVADERGNKCEMQEIAIDGVYLDKPREPLFGKSLLITGGRLDWLVKCEKPGNYSLKSDFKESDFHSLVDHPTFVGDLMKIHVVDNTSDSSIEPMLTNLPYLPTFLQDLRNEPDEKIKGRFTVEVTPTDTLGREDYMENYPRTKSLVNTIQEWNFVNTEFETSHPIHMHINHMQVVSYNKYEGPVGIGNDDGQWKLFDHQGNTCTFQHSHYNESIEIEFPENATEALGHEDKHEGSKSFGYAQVGEWRDTLLVPPLGNITVRFLTHEFTGDVMLHCHLTGDEDQGMMMTTQIVQEGANMAANENSGDAAPGSCMVARPYDPSGNKASVLMTSSFQILSFLLLYFVSAMMHN